MPKVTMTTREIEQMITDAVRKTPACQAFQSISLYIVPQLQRQYDAMESNQQRPLALANPPPPARPQLGVAPAGVDAQGVMAALPPAMTSSPEISLPPQPSSAHSIGLSCESRS
jgi:hypothetical protein